MPWGSRRRRLRVPLHMAGGQPLRRPLRPLLYALPRNRHTHTHMGYGDEFAPIGCYFRQITASNERRLCFRPATPYIRRAWQEILTDSLNESL